MAKRRTKPAAETNETPMPDAHAPEAPAGRARETGQTVVYQVEVPVPLHATLEEIRRQRRWTKRALVLEALERLAVAEAPPDGPADD